MAGLREDSCASVKQSKRKSGFHSWMEVEAGASGGEAGAEAFRITQEPGVQPAASRQVLQSRTSGFLAIF